jgi:hypothetical protein
VRRPALLGLAAVGAFLWASAGARAIPTADTAVWSLGGPQVRISERSDQSALSTRAGVASVRASGIAIHGSDGNVEVEHDGTTPNTVLDARNRGGHHTTTLRVGAADGQDVTTLVVPKASGGTHPVQVWRAGGRTVAAIDSHGRLSLNGVTLVPVVDATGETRLEAVLPDGSTQILVAVRR